MVLDDNTVIPHYMGATSRGRPMDTGAQTNLGLRVGEVKELVYPDDSRSVSKRFIEYSVEVQHQDGSGPGTTSVYTGCLLANLFGGAADALHYTLRADDHKSSGDDGFGSGSKVLLLCVNGQTTRALIIGGVRDSKVDQSSDTKAGHNLAFSFNGVSVTINSDGEFQLQFGGATVHDGSLASTADAAAAPTTIAIHKNGNLRVYTKDGNQSILIDHENKKAFFNFDQAWNVNVNKDVNETYGGDWNVDTNGVLSFFSKQSVGIEASGGTMTLQASGQSFIKSAGLQVGAATDATMKGTTFRLAQATLHAQLIAGLTAVGAQIGAAGASITAATVPMLIPVVGAMIAAPILAPAGIALTTAVASLVSMVAALTAFEAGAATHLSLVNKND